MSQKWTKLEKPEGAPWPVERTRHAACCLNYADHKPKLLVTGGLDKNLKTLSDAWLLDINTRRWREVREVTEVEGCVVCVTKPSTSNMWMMKSVLNSFISCVHS